MGLEEGEPLQDLVELTRRLHGSYPPEEEMPSYGRLQALVSTISTMHAYNYLAILESLRTPSEELAGQVMGMLETSIEAIKRMVPQIEHMGVAPRGLALLLSRNVRCIEERIRQLADSCPEHKSDDDPNDDKDQAYP